MLRRAKTILSTLGVAGIIGLHSQAAGLLGDGCTGADLKIPPTRCPSDDSKGSEFHWIYITSKLNRH